MCMPMKSNGHLMSVQRFGQSGGTKERKYGFRFAYYCFPDRSIMEHSDFFYFFMFCIQSRQGPFKMQRLVHGFLNKSFHCTFTKKRKHVFVKTATKTFHTCKPYIVNDHCFPIEHMHTLFQHDLPHQFMPSFFV